MRKHGRKKGRNLCKSTMAVSMAASMILSSASAAWAGDVSANGKYYSGFESYAKLLEYVGEVNTQTAEEGQVLLKNDGTLPLSGSEKVSVFGVASSTTIAGPTSDSAYKQNTDFEVSERGPIYDGLEAAGFQVNPTLADYYAEKGFSNEDCGKETTDFSEDAAASVSEYNQVGVVVLARYGGEGSDLDMITGEVNDNMYGEQESKYEHDALYKGTYQEAEQAEEGRGGMPMMGRSSYNVAETSANYSEEGTEYKHYLQLTDAEEELIDYVSQNCEKVVVVLNTSNAMECYDLREDERVNGILLMGRGGETGHYAVGEILAGLVNPSGKLADEWNTDFTADPTWNNFAWNSQTGSQNMYSVGEFGTGVTEYNGNGNYDDYLERGETEVSYGTHNQNGYYGTDYEEDIYLGYAYWETLYHEIYSALLENETITYQGNGTTHTVSRGEGDTVEAQAAAGANEWWKKNVTFAFGSGLSYTTFSFDIDSSAITAYGGALESKDDMLVDSFDISTDMTMENLSSSDGNPAAVKTLVVPVTVTNTGDTAGKETVELYVTAPYDSEDAKLQKSFVTLAGFEKTDILEPGESETVYVSINTQDMASFDSYDAYEENVTGYTLETGEYTIRAMSTSHYDVATDVNDTTDDYAEVKFEISETSESGSKGAARLILDDFSGKASSALFSEDYDGIEKVDGNVWAEDTDEDHYQAYNSLRTSNLMADGESEEVLLTRDTFLTYFPETPTEGDLTFSESYVEHLDYWNQFSAADTESDDWYHTAEEAEAEGWAQNTGAVDEENGTYEIVLADMAGIELFDEDGTLTDEWNTFINQLTVEEMVSDQWGWDGFFITDGYSGFSRCTTMATMIRSYVVPLPLMGRIPEISGRYDEETGKFYAYTGAWDTEYDFYNDDFATTTTEYNDRGSVADEGVTGGFRGEEVESYTQWYYLRMLAARILYAEANALTNLNGHSLTTLPTLSSEERTFAAGSEVNVNFDLSGEAKSTYTVDEDGNKELLYTKEYSIEGDLPAGLTFDTETGVLSGTADEEGEYIITVSVLIDGWVSADLVNDDKDSFNPGLRKSYKLLVNEDGVPTADMDIEPVIETEEETEEAGMGGFPGGEGGFPGEEGGFPGEGEAPAEEGGK